MNVSKRRIATVGRTTAAGGIAGIQGRQGRLGGRPERKYARLEYANSFAAPSPQARQASEGESLDAQRRQPEGYAIMHGLTLDEIVVEKGVTGSVPVQDLPADAEPSSPKRDETLWMLVTPGSLLRL